jgi:hypothetical protein
MTKKLVAIPEGNLLRIAATKSITTLSALQEKTDVDRKTLRTINTGQPVKETTLQAIADKLRVPLAHLLGPSTLDEVEKLDRGLPPFLEPFPGYQFREIKLQQLDAAALRRLAEKTDEIAWLLKIDQMSESLEATLLKLGESLRGWFHHLLTVEDSDAPYNLVDQISYIKTSADIDKCVEQLAKANLKIYGGTYVRWDKERLEQPRDPYGDHPPLQILKYTSQTKAVLSIAPEDKSNSTLRVAAGWEPPQKFTESELAGIDSVVVDSRQVWSRNGEIRVRGLMDDEIPF